MIRDATHADVEEMTEMVMRIKRASVYAGVPPNKERIRKTIRQCVSGPQAYARVVDRNGKIVAQLIGLKDQMPFADRMEAKDLWFLSERPEASAPLLRDFCAWGWSDQRVANVLVSQSSGIEVERTTKWFEHEGFNLVGGVFYLNRWDVEGQKVAV